MTDHVPFFCSFHLDLRRLRFNLNLCRMIDQTIQTLNLVLKQNQMKWNILILSFTFLLNEHDFFWGNGINVRNMHYTHNLIATSNAIYNNKFRSIDDKYSRKKFVNHTIRSVCRTIGPCYYINIYIYIFTWRHWPDVIFRLIWKRLWFSIGFNFIQLDKNRKIKTDRYRQTIVWETFSFCVFHP